MKTISLLCLTLFLSNPSAQAEHRGSFRNSPPAWKGNERSERTPPIQLAEPTGQGSGCPEGTMRIVFAPDNLSFSILFDQFVAEVIPGNANNSRTIYRDNISCSVIVPIIIPEGMQMSITRVDYRGFAGLPAGTIAQLQSRISFFERDRSRWGDGRQKDTTLLQYIFRGPTAEDYFISSGVIDETRPASVAYTSPCGGATRFKIDNSITLSSRSNEEARVTLDSIDGSSNATYYVNWQKCTDNFPNKKPMPGAPQFPGHRAGGRGAGRIDPPPFNSGSGSHVGHRR